MSRKKVLIIEDDTELSNLYRERLELANYEVGQCLDGETGVTRVLADCPDLVLLDLMLPRKGGIHVLQIIRTQPHTKKIPVVVFTALYDTKYRDDAMRCGADAFFFKAEVTPSNIVEKITEILEGKSA